MGKRETAETRKPEILENYYKVITKEGIEGASIGKVGKQMGIHPSLVIHYFGSKENLNIELMHTVGETYRSMAMWGSLEEYADPKERFEEFLNIVFGEAWWEALDDLVFYALHYLAFRNRTIRDIWDASYDYLEDYLTSQIRAFAKEGVIEVPDPELTAQMIICMREGIDFRGSFSGEGSPSETLLEAAKESVRILTNARKRKKRSKDRRRSR